MENYLIENVYVKCCSINLPKDNSHIHTHYFQYIQLYCYNVLRLDDTFHLEQGNLIDSLMSKHRSQYCLVLVLIFCNFQMQHMIHCT